MTNLQAGQQDPADLDVVEAYGENGRLVEKIREGTGAVAMANPDATNPLLVADFIRDLIAMPKGGRPVRVTVGLDFGLQDVNLAVRRFQQQFLGALGMGHTERVAPGE